MEAYEYIKILSGSPKAKNLLKTRQKRKVLPEYNPLDWMPPSDRHLILDHMVSQQPIA